jgi:preprotein translocase subunit SecA
VFWAVNALRAQGLDPHETPEEYEAAWDATLRQAEESVAAEHDEVTELGGLYVLGTERHESRRIDNQLRGRSGRQGDPGESRFYLSLQDDLMRMFNAGMVDRVMSMTGLSDDVPIEAKMVTRSIASAQAQVEAQHFETRKNVLKYDDVLNRQREVIYAERRRVLAGEDLHQQVRDFINDVVTEYVTVSAGQGLTDGLDLEKLWDELRQVYPVSLTVEEVVEQAGGRGAVTAADLVELLTSDAQHAYDAREESVGQDVMRDVERRVVLQVLDRKWREHLYEMDYLKEGIGLRAMAQRDPLVEYQREGYDMFVAMLDGLKEESVGFLFNVAVEAAPQTAPVVTPMSQNLAEFAAAAAQQADSQVATKERPTGVQAKGIGGGSGKPALTYSGPAEDGSAEVKRSGGGAATTSGGTRKERREAARKGRKR